MLTHGGAVAPQGGVVDEGASRLFSCIGHLYIGIDKQHAGVVSEPNYV